MSLVLGEAGGPSINYSHTEDPQTLEPMATHRTVLPRRAQLNGLRRLGHVESKVRMLRTGCESCSPWRAVTSALSWGHLAATSPRSTWPTQAAAAALHAAAGTFNIVDDQPLTKREYADAMARAAGAAMWLRDPAGPPGLRPAHLADPVAAREQRPIPGRGWMGATLSQRSCGLDRHRSGTQIPRTRPEPRWSAADALGRRTSAG